MKVKNPSHPITQKRIDSILSSNESKSKKMIGLFELGMEVKAIADLMGTRYNFVYNVVSNHIVTKGIEVVKEDKGESKKDQIIRMYEEGKSLKEIQVDLKTNYNYVFNVVKGYKEKQG